MKENLTIDALIRLSAEVEVDLVHQKQSVLLAVMAMARREAAAALDRIIADDLISIDAIRADRDVVLRYRNLCAWLHSILAKGIDAQQMLRAEEREDIQDAVGLGAEDMETLRAYGLTDGAEDR